MSPLEDWREDELEPGRLTQVMLSPQVSLTSPQEMGVPHSTWRENQLSALQFIVGAKESTVVTELPTGSGKSAIPTAIGQNNNVLVLVNSLSLLDQYEEAYGFNIVKGMAQYTCVNRDKVEYWKAKTGRAPKVSECTYEKMSDCPVFDTCPYIVARDRALNSQRMACTYPFALLSRGVQQRQGVMVMDECHLAADTIVGLSEKRFGERFRRDFNLPPFPTLIVTGVLGSYDRKRLIDWFNAASQITSKPPASMFPEDEAKWRNANARLVYTMMELIDRSRDFFYLYSTEFEEERYTSHGQLVARKLPGFSVKPMSARWHAQKIMASKLKTVMMSATIGDISPLAHEMGISNYAFRSYPHPVPISHRPVYDLGMERMTWENIKNFPTLFKIQGRKIELFLQQLPSTWRGIILTSSYYKATQLKNYFATSAMADRIFLPPDGVNRVDTFLKDGREGIIVIDPIQTWGHGLDLHHDLARFAIVASVPFGNHLDPYHKARIQYFGSSEYSWWESYMAVPQACGRVSRGERQEDDWMLNVAALADGSATTKMAYKYYPPWFKEAVMPFQGG